MAFPDAASCFIVYTSGSTGQPQGIVSQRSVLCFDPKHYRRTFHTGVKMKSVPSKVVGEHRGRRAARPRHVDVTPALEIEIAHIDPIHPAGEIGDVS